MIQGSRGMAGLARGWFESDGGLSHAVDPDKPSESLCGMADPYTRNDPDDSWADAPAPRCQRCEGAASRRQQAGVVAENYDVREAQSLNARRAAEELKKLRSQADLPEIRRNGPEHKGWKAKVVAIMQAGLGQDSHTLREFQQLRYTVGVWSGAPGEAQRDAQYFARRVDDAGGLIDAAIYQLELLEGSPDEGNIVMPTGPIFVVHGRDDAHKHELMRLLDRTAEPEAIVLHEQANRGATILEKFERHAQAASFAIVLLTGDDEGRLRGADGPLNPRGRQNVVLELGVFMGLLGRKNVVVLRGADVDNPSDLGGLMYISLDDEQWRFKLLKELEAAGIPVDFSRIP